MSKTHHLLGNTQARSNAAIICIIGMFAGFMLSRVGLSIFMFAFGGIALYGIHPRQWLRERWWLLGVAWVALYALSWFWSADKHYWGIRQDVKLPVLLLPLAFALLPRFTPRQLQALTVTLAILLMASALYSTSFVLLQPEYYIHGYRQSHMLPTLPKHDHIRASTSMALFVAWVAYVWPALTSRSAKWICGTATAVLVVYLHILAAKSGLVSLYLFVAAWAVYAAVAQRRRAALLALAAIPVVVALAVRYVPTFRERANYLEYTMYMMKTGDKSGLGDANRLMSYKAAVTLVKQHPFTGVGTGDLMDEMTAEYNRLYPQVPQEGVLLPHNQFLIVALGCGLPALAVFAAWVAAPLRRLRRNRTSFYFGITWLILLIQLMIEPALEVQYGVFLYLFFLLLMRKQVTDEKASSVP